MRHMFIGAMIVVVIVGLLILGSLSGHSRALHRVVSQCNAFGAFSFETSTLSDEKILVYECKLKS